MLLPRLQPPLRAAIASIGRAGSSTNPQACLSEAFAQLNICRASTRLGNVRHASHKAQGAVNKAKDGPGKRLGAKKSGGLSTWLQSALLFRRQASDLSFQSIPKLTTQTKQNNMSSLATSSSAKGERTGSLAKTAPWAATTPSTPPNPAT